MTINPCTVHNHPRHRVTWQENGKCCRKVFKTLAAAKTFAAVTRQEVKDYGAAFSTLPAHERAAILAAFARASKAGYAVADACDFYERNHAANGTTTVAELVKLCLAAKKAKGLRPDSQRFLGISLGVLEATHGAKRASEVTAAELATLLNRPSWGPRRRLGVLKDWKNAFNWGIRNKLLDSNPAKGVDAPIQDDAPIAIFTPEQCRTLLALTAKRFPALVPTVVVCLFAGLRTAEALRLDWKQVDLERGLLWVGVGVSKTRSARLVRLRDAAVLWLASRRGKGSIAPQNAAKALHRLHKAFGSWPRNVLRHTWASCELAASDDAAATALQAGHGEGVLFRHYRQLVSWEDARRFWALTPEKLPPLRENEARNAFKCRKVA
jgi:integrase